MDVSPTSGVSGVLAVAKTKRVVHGAGERSVRIEHTTDGGKSWTPGAVITAPDPAPMKAGIMAARFVDETTLVIELDHGMNSEFEYTYTTMDDGKTWTRKPGGGFRMKPPPK